MVGLLAAEQQPGHRLRTREQDRAHRVLAVDRVHGEDGIARRAPPRGRRASARRGVGRADRGGGGGGARSEGTIGFASLRGGSVVGDHQVVFASEGERLELGHRGDSRSIFAKGAVKAAMWLAGRPAGRYNMAEVLGL